MVEDEVKEIEEKLKKLDKKLDKKIPKNLKSLGKGTTEILDILDKTIKKSVSHKKNGR